MRQLYHTTELIGIKDKNITLTKVFQHETHIEVQATLDYTPPKCCYCQGKQIKYDFQKPSKIPFIEIGGLLSLIRLKKRRFQCKVCRKVTVSETSLVRKNCQISELVKQKTAQLLLNREALTHIAEKLAFSTSTVYRKLKQFQFKDNFSTLPEVLSWDEFSYQKGKLAFIAQDYNTKKIITILDNRRQAIICNHFFKYSKEAREGGKIVTMDMSGNYIPLIMLLRSPVSRLRLKQSIPRLFHSQILKLFLTVFTLSNT